MRASSQVNRNEPFDGCRPRWGSERREQEARTEEMQKIRVAPLIRFIKHAKTTLRWKKGHPTSAYQIATDKPAQHSICTLLALRHCLARRPRPPRTHLPPSPLEAKSLVDLYCGCRKASSIDLVRLSKACCSLSSPTDRPAMMFESSRSSDFQLSDYETGASKQASAHASRV